MKDSSESVEPINNSDRMRKLINDYRPRNGIVFPIEGCTCPKPLLSPLNVCRACWDAFHGEGYYVKHCL